MKKIILLLILSVLIAGCTQEITCDKPNILIGTECCLDQNGNSICDKDEVVKETIQEPEEPVIEEPVPEPVVEEPVPEPVIEEPVPEPVVEVFSIGLQIEEVITFDQDEDKLDEVTVTMTNKGEKDIKNPQVIIQSSIDGMEFKKTYAYYQLVKLAVNEPKIKIVSPERTYSSNITIYVEIEDEDGNLIASKSKFIEK